MRLPKKVEMDNDKITANAALNVKNPNRDAPGIWYSFSKYWNR
jgi:hypothetical protein